MKHIAERRAGDSVIMGVTWTWNRFCLVGAIVISEARVFAQWPSRYAYRGAMPLLIARGDGDAAAAAAVVASRDCRLANVVDDAFRLRAPLGAFLTC